jgi:DNA replication protein DnaC
METLASKITNLAFHRTGVSDMPNEFKDCTLHGGTGSPGVDYCFKCFEERDRARVEDERIKWLQELKDREVMTQLGRAAIPDRFSGRFLSNYVAECQKSKRALAVASNYAENFSEALRTGSSLIFCGDVGTGKTHLAVGIAHEVMAAGCSAVFTSVIRAVRSVKETYSRSSQITEAEAIANLVLPDLLILDEVGAQFGSDTEKLILFEIINGRYESMRPTIVISNLAVPALEEFLGTRSFDRLREGGGKLIVFDWASYRKKVTQ